MKKLLGWLMISLTAASSMGILIYSLSSDVTFLCSIGYGFLIVGGLAGFAIAIKLLIIGVTGEIK